MSPIKSPRQLAKADGRTTYVSARHPCPRCGGRKRFTSNGGCKNCQDVQRAAGIQRAKEHAALLGVSVNALKLRPPADVMGAHVCPTCKRPWPVEGET